jgi:serine/threonine protein kinase
MTADLSLATLSGRFELREIIGRGGMGAVYRALDTELDRLVAIKIFAGTEDDDNARWRREVRLLGRTSHPNLVALYDASPESPADDGDPDYLVMELIDGPSLKVELEYGPLNGRDLASLAIELADALEAVHAAGIVHRDIKPGNVLLAPSGVPEPAYRAKLADFGIAQLVGSPHLTTTGTVLGTVAYLSPEQIAGATVGPAADIYSLALVLIEAMTGRQPYPGTIAESIAARMTDTTPVPADLPQSWKQLLAAMTAKDPSERPSARELATFVRAHGADIADWAAPASTDRDTVAFEALDFNSSPLPETTVTEGLPGRGRGSRSRRLLVGVLLAATAIAAAAALVLGTLTERPVAPSPATHTGMTTTIPTTTPTSPEDPTPAPAPTPSQNEAQESSPPTSTPGIATGTQTDGSDSQKGNPHDGPSGGNPHTEKNPSGNPHDG